MQISEASPVLAVKIIADWTWEAAQCGNDF